MIGDLLLNMLYALLEGVTLMLPASGSLPTAVQSALSYIAPFINQANALFPIDQLYLAFNYAILIETGLLTFKIFNWIVNKIRGSG